MTDQEVGGEPARQSRKAILSQDRVEHMLTVEAVGVVALERATELMPGLGRQAALPGGRLAAAEDPSRVQLAADSSVRSGQQAETTTHLG